MNYQETLNYLYSALPMFSRIGSAAIKKDLANTIALLEKIGNPHNAFRSVHIAGTNGKGSVSHMIAAILQQAGFKTGLYTSPHLKDFRERIKINGEPVTEAFVIRFTRQMQSHIEEIHPSFFEITVAMALSYFAENKVDVAVIETGLGGRLDSTNVITPELSVITNIGFDHMDILGHTLEKIASEKAGIIKQGVPVVIGETMEATKPVFADTAVSLNAPIVFADAEHYVDDWQSSLEGLIVDVVNNGSHEKQKYSTDLGGIYQTKNMVTVLSAIAQLRKMNWPIADEHIHNGLAHVKKSTGLHGRWELVHRTPNIVLDVGHNVDGIRQICNQLEHIEYHHLHVVMGMVKDKDVEKALALLPRQAKYYFTKAQIPRAMPEDQLMKLASEIGLDGNSYPEVKLALQTALDHSVPDDLILVCGSVFVVGEVDLTHLKLK